MTGADTLARREAILDRLTTIIVVLLRVERELDEIDPDAPLFGTGLALDSVDAVDLWVNISVEFRMENRDAVERIAAMRTLNTLTDLILAHTEASP